ncbi:hypothetical protein AN2V17_01500 [Vallitalea sp. AN17-2]|uniref:Uncharacterized protein n=1 Tax=Vallitalea maricola TaxID=3074433 RepID=A0ACB5UEG8_9FIRM|nr:hypothetical protein AN2V17_01500 [Vallitalea sp. AN17-2]
MDFIKNAEKVTCLFSRQSNLFCFAFIVICVNFKNILIANYYISLYKKWIIFYIKVIKSLKSNEKSIKI